jgi:hypothetical protein
VAESERCVNVRDKFYYKGEKPVYYNECAAHSNVYRGCRISHGGVLLNGPVCDPEHKVEKLMSMFVPLDEFEAEWKEVPSDPKRDQAVEQ